MKIYHNYIAVNSISPTSQARLHLPLGWKVSSECGQVFKEEVVVGIFFNLCLRVFEPTYAMAFLLRENYDNQCNYIYII